MNRERAATVTALAALPREEDHNALREIFRRCNWNLHLVRTLPDVQAALHEVPAGVVIGECRFPDGQTWKNLAEVVRTLDKTPPLIVASPWTDRRLWAEVLNLGGFDLLSKPFLATEVFHTVSYAWSAWRTKVLAGRWTAA